MMCNLQYYTKIETLLVADKNCTILDYKMSGGLDMLAAASRSLVIKKNRGQELFEYVDILDTGNHRLGRGQSMVRGIKHLKEIGLLNVDFKASYKSGRREVSALMKKSIS